jgi:hypothetical protein
MGDVYLAHDPTLGRDVAIKLLRRDAAQAGLSEEARALAAMHHLFLKSGRRAGETGCFQQTRSLRDLNPVRHQ